MMEDKPRRVVIHFMEAMRRMAGETLEVDVPPGEKLCGACGGLGIVRADWSYGLKGAPLSDGFPYRQRFFHACPNCLTGSVPVCPHCGSDIPVRIRRDCPCSGAYGERIAAEREKERSRYEKARRIEPDSEEARGMGMLYWEGACNDGFCRDMEDFMDWWVNEHGGAGERPAHIWGTQPVRLRVDSMRALEHAFEPLHEDARDSVSDADYAELEEYLDRWCARQERATSYLPDQTVLVRVPWED